MRSGGRGREDVQGFNWIQKEGACEWSLSLHVVRTTRVSSRGGQGPWLPGTLTSHDLSCASETGPAGERYRGRRAFLERGWGGREVRATAGAKARRKNESAARREWHGDFPDWSREFLQGDGGSDDWIAKVGPDLEGFECPTEEHSTQLLPRDFRSRPNYLKGG